jgi:hypothetical protein
MLCKALELLSSYKHNNEPSGSIKVGNFLTSWVTISFSSTTLIHIVIWLEGPLLRSHELPIGSYPMPYESSPHPHTLFV